jgi:hypothetical protein
MHPHGIDVGSVEQGLVGAGIVGADALDQFVLAQKAARLGFGRGGRRRRDRDGGGRRRLGKRNERLCARVAQ